METPGHTVRNGSPLPLDWRGLGLVVVAHALVLGGLVGLHPAVDRAPPPAPIFAELLQADEPATAPASPEPAAPEPAEPVEQEPVPVPMRPAAAEPKATPQLAVAEITPAPTSSTVAEPAADPGPTQATATEHVPASEPTRSSPDALAGNPDDVRRYIAAIMRQLNRYKTYPRELKKAKVEGTVVIEFEIDEAGRLLASAVKQSSGQPELDRAAMEMLARANPLPAIPEFMHRDELALAIPVEYSLITDR